ncbi:MAG: hypothetical protein LBE09_08545 [Christensenellaceae bacterium]|jgi:hypothetical protein|nr:hypothetical protein [Christensenellaceae bacterium]
MAENKSNTLPRTGVRPASAGGAYGSRPGAYGPGPSSTVGGYRRPGQQSRSVPPKSEKELRKLNRARKRERDYFFVMRKPICFLIFLFSLVLIGVCDIGFLPDTLPIPAQVAQYTAFMVKPDYTPLDQRKAYEDAANEEAAANAAEGEKPEAITYTTKDVYVSFTDIFYSATGKAGFLAAPESVLPEVELYNDILQRATDYATDSTDMMTTLAPTILTYAPLATLVLFNFAVITLILGFFGMFGKRIFRYMLIGLLVLIGAVGAFGTGLSSLGAYVVTAEVQESPDDEEAAQGEDQTDAPAEAVVLSTIDFAQAMTFIQGAFAAIPDTQEQVKADAPVIVAGYGFLIAAGSALLILILSLFARKKIPYAVFDR